SSAALWFSCFHKVMTSDKFVYLFGRVIPSLSLVLSMALRFVPKFSAQFRNVRNAQRCIGRDVFDGSLINRIKNGIRIISIMLSWSMENAIETADSMKSRGFGLKGRTAYSIYKFDRRDLIVLIMVSLLGVSVSVSAIMGVIDFNYYPSIKGNLADVLSLVTFFLYGILMLIPTILNAGEGIKWKRLRSAT
ncbi:MAG: energy-coupling factor transporter transmembrane component T, partial [Ruminococcus sp.]|nr:energy-coupling factor transporter transmembrane component T [Ruminococcus sp.]